jgi:Reverse transcriptase (RNA-dependent DNA polymerase)
LWLKTMEEEFKNMEDHQIFTPVEVSYIPSSAKILSTTLGNDKEANGRFKARIIARGFEQVDGEHFDCADKASPVVNDITIRVILSLIVMAGLWAEIVMSEGHSSRLSSNLAIKCMSTYHKGLKNIIQEMSSFSSIAHYMVLVRLPYTFGKSCARKWVS